MTLSKNDLLRLHQEQTARAVRQRAMCLPSEEIVLVVAGKANKAEQARAYNHLVACAECAAEFRAILPLQPWAEQVTSNANARVPEISLTMASVGAANTKKNNAPVAWGQKYFLLLQRPAFFYIVVTFLLLTTIAAVWWAISLRQANQHLLAAVSNEAAVKTQANQSLEETRRQLEETNRRVQQYEKQLADLRLQFETLSQPQPSLMQPQANISILDLEPRGSIRSTTVVAKQIDVSADASVFTCILNVTGQLTFPDYALEIIDQTGDTLWSTNGLTKSPQNTFTLVLPSALLPAGRYHFKLSGVQGKQKKLIEEYAVQLTYR